MSTNALNVTKGKRSEGPENVKHWKRSEWPDNVKKGEKK